MLVVPFPAGEATSQTAGQAMKDTARGQGRALALSVLQDGKPATTIRAGMHPEAESGLDRYDQYGPPGYFGAATLRLMQEDSQTEQEGPTALAAEYRPRGEEGQAYELRLRAKSDTALTLRAEGLGAFRGEEVAIVEKATGEAHDLKAGQPITIVPRSEEAHYRLLVGSEAFVAEEKQAVRPSQVKLLPNYPNPFSGQTTIEYALPEAQEVRLVAYDVLGRRVAVLANGRKEGGFHRVRWDAGDRLSSGTYLLRLQAGSSEVTRRVTLVR